MSAILVGLLSVACGLICLIGLAVATAFNSRKIQYLEETQMSQEQELQQAIGEVQAAFEGYKSRQDAIIAALEEKNANTPQIDLTDEIAELKAIRNSMDGTFETLPDEPAPEAGSTPETAEEAPGEADSGPSGEATPEGEVSEGEVTPAGGV